MGFFKVNGGVLVIEDFPTEDGKFEFNLPVLELTDSAEKFYGKERGHQLLNGIAALLNAFGTHYCRQPSGTPEVNLEPRKIKHQHGFGHADVVRDSTWKSCPLCDAPEFARSRHHLAPRANGKPRLGPILMICKPCHTDIHALFTNDELRHVYNTQESLKQALAYRRKNGIPMDAPRPRKSTVYKRFPPGDYV